MARGKYKQKRLNQLRRRISISSLELPARIVVLLEGAGIKTLYDLNMLVKQYDITRLPKLGRDDEKIIRTVLDDCEYRKKI